MERRDLREAFELLRIGRLEEARAIFEELLRMNPGDVGARFGLGCVYAAMGDRDRAVEEWRHCLELNPHMGEAHYALAWAHYDAEDYQKGYQHVELAYESGVSPSLARRLVQLLKAGVERIGEGEPSEIARKVELEEVKEPRESRLGAVSVYLILSLSILMVLWYTKAIIGFPRGWDAYFHIYRIKYILRFFPNFFWNYQWDSGVPHFAGSYPPMSYYIVAALIRLTGLPIEMMINGWLGLNILINLLGLSAFLYNITDRREPPLLAVLLLIFTPAFWDYWFNGGNYPRVFSMGLIGPSLYLASEIYYKKKRNKLLLLLLPILSSLAITIHLIGGLLNLALILFYIFFRTRNLIDKFKNMIKIFIPIIALCSFYITQYLFSNPQRRSGLYFTYTFNPAKFEILIVPNSITSLNTLTIPTLMVLIIVYLYIKRKYKILHKNIEVIKAINVFIILSVISILYAYIGYIPSYPKNLYINAIPPQHVLSIASIGLCLVNGCIFSMILNIIPFRIFSKRIIRILIFLPLILCILLGFSLEMPILMREILCNDKFSELELIVIDEDELQHRVGSEALGLRIGAFGCHHLVPQTRGYFFQGIPYLNWYSWQYNALFQWRGNVEETEFILDWHAIKWILIDKNPEKFLSMPDHYLLLSHKDKWYEFEYLNASSILSATNAFSLLFVGDERCYNVFLRAIGITGLGSDECVMVRGDSRYIDSYSLSELLEFDVIVLYGYDYKSLEMMADLLSQYLEAGRGIFMEANGSPDYDSENLPEPFPISETFPSSVVDEWLFNVSAHSIAGGVNFTSFAPPLFGGNPWGISTTNRVRRWGEVVLMSDGRPLIVVGEYGGGRVVWSGMNLFYHELDHRNVEEGRFIARMLRWLGGAEGRPTPRHSVEFINPQRRVVSLDEPAGGVLFKEHYFKQWHATLVGGDGSRKKLDIYMAGPGMMYIPLPDFSPPAKVVLTYSLSLPERAGYILSLSSLIILVLIVWRRPTLIYPEEGAPPQLI